MKTEAPMTDNATTGAMLVFASPADATRDAEFNEWYDSVHIPEILAKVPGVVAARRYRLNPSSPSAPAPYVTIYDLDRPAAEVLANFGAARGELTLSDSLGSGERAPSIALYDAD